MGVTGLALADTSYATSCPPALSAPPANGGVTAGWGGGVGARGGFVGESDCLTREKKLIGTISFLGLRGGAPDTSLILLMLLCEEKGLSGPCAVTLADLLIQTPKA